VGYDEEIMLWRRSVGVSLLAFLLLLVGGCRSTRQIATSKSVPPAIEKGAAEEPEGARMGQTGTGTEKAEALPAEGFCSLTARTELRFDWKGEEAVFPAELRMVRDSVIVLSVRPVVGLEAVYVRLEDEGFLVVDRFNHLCTEGCYADLSFLFSSLLLFGADSLSPPEGVTFHSIQRILCEHVFLPEWQSFFDGRFAVRFSRIQTDVPLSLDRPVLSAKYRSVPPEEWFKSLKKP
jgi:hypothetical protein